MTVIFNYQRTFTHFFIIQWSIHCNYCLYSNRPYLKCNKLVTRTIYSHNRKEQVVLTRCRIFHGRVYYFYYTMNNHKLLHSGTMSIILLVVFILSTIRSRFRCIHGVKDYKKKYSYMDDVSKSHNRCPQVICWTCHLNV